MTEFNKLYNLILQSIIVEDKNTLISMIKKYRDDLQDPEQIINYLTDKYNNYKLNLLLTNCICNLTLGGIDSLEKRQNDIAKVVTILKKVPSVNVYQYTDIDTLLSEYDFVLRKSEDKQKMFDPKYLDSIPVFSNKEQLQNGIVIYTVKDNEFGQRTIRQIVDTQLGKDANPWCIIARKNGDMFEAKRFWDQYSGCPKRVAFQNGKILAFQASTHGKRVWYDLQDVGTSYLKDKDGNEIYLKSDQEGNRQYKLNLIQQLKSKMTYNEKTGRYDSNTQVTVLPEMILDGHFPFKFGQIQGRFICNHCHDLVSLQNGPTKVWLDYEASSIGIKNLIGAPEYIGGGLTLEYCPHLETLQGAPEFVGNSLIVRYCDNLVSLKGGPKRVYGGCFVSDNAKLKSLQGMPKKIGWGFNCQRCGKKFTFKDLPEGTEIGQEEEY